MGGRGFIMLKEKEIGFEKIANLVLVLNENHLLLGMKKRGFGVGKWNGFGGKVEKGESIEESANRELFEESGLKSNKLIKIGINHFYWQENKNEPLEVHIFRTEDFSGELIETEEMSPKWFSVGKIPFDLMWSDDVYWLPLFLEGKKFKGKFLFDKEDRVVEYILDEVKEF
jgi:8-oxo-dGTP diphosphatase/2-hydroxy-dATP diphosphatase